MKSYLEVFGIGRSLHDTIDRLEATIILPLHQASIAVAGSMTSDTIA